jgi:hypothetical protein
MDAVTLKLAKNYTDSVFAGGDSPAKIYGVSWTKGSSPVLTRIHDAVGMVANVGIGSQIVQNDFDNAQIYREIGTVIDDYGNVFRRIPKFYIRKEDRADYKSWEVSKYRYPGFYLPWLFWDFTNNKELPYYDHGKHKGSITGGKLESKPDVWPTVNQTIIQNRTAAQANNTGGLAGYQQLDIHAIDVLRTLMFVEFATLNMQNVMQGYTTGQYLASHVALATEAGANRIILTNAQAAAYRVGQPVGCGTTLGGNQRFADRTITAIQVDTPAAGQTAIVFDGAAINVVAGDILYNTGWKNGFSAGIAASSGCIIGGDGKYPAAYRGIESPYGDLYQFVDALNITNYQAWVCKNAAQYASNLFASPYEQLSYANYDVSDVYIRSMGFDPARPFCELPTSAATVGTEYYCDRYYCAGDQRIARCGSYWNSGAYAGPSAWYLYDTSGNAGVNVVGRLLKKAS